MEKVYASRAFALLQQGMKDRFAYVICFTLLTFNSAAWEEFERWAKARLDEEEARNAI